MNNIYNYLSDNTKAKHLLFDCIDSLISDGKTSFYSLDETEKKEITGLFLKAMNLSDMFACINEHKNSEAVVGALANYLISQNQEAKNEISEILVRHAVEYYEETLDEEFRDRAERYEEDSKETRRVYATCSDAHYL